MNNRYYLIGLVALMLFAAGCTTYVEQPRSTGYNPAQGCSVDRIEYTHAGKTPSNYSCEEIDFMLKHDSYEITGYGKCTYYKGCSMISECDPNSRVGTKSDYLREYKEKCLQDSPESGE